QRSSWTAAGACTDEKAPNAHGAVEDRSARRSPPAVGMDHHTMIDRHRMVPLDRRPTDGTDEGVVLAEGVRRRATDDVGVLAGLGEREGLGVLLTAWTLVVFDLHRDGPAQALEHDRRARDRHPSALRHASLAERRVLFAHDRADTLHLRHA